MRHPWSAFEIGYVTLQFDSAFLVGAGEGERLFDSVFVTDANGLPCLPGPALAGVLRHALADGRNPATDDRCGAVFGYQEHGEGQSSRVRLSFAHAHGQDDRPVPFRGARRDDPVLAFLAAGVSRDHVRLGGHGAADHRGKFDELLVPAGARFTFELVVSHLSPVSLSELVALLGRNDVRIGRASRRGLGRFSVVRARVARFDLANREDLVRLGRLPVALEKAALSSELAPLEVESAPRAAGWVRGQLRLTPLGTWAVGGGLPTGREPQREKPWDRLPLSEREIRWEGSRGRVIPVEESRYLLPASSLKGSLRHRTAFHARKAAGAWLGEGTWPEGPTQAEKALFGEVRGSHSGRPGRVHLSDVYVEAPTAGLNHVSLDRFTQGPMDHLLFDEVALGECELKIDVAIRTGDDLPRPHRAALAAALDDLCSGRLAVGAGRGHGRFRGEISWEDGSSWLQEGPEHA